MIRRHIRFYYEELSIILSYFPSGEFTQKELIEKHGKFKNFRKLITRSLIKPTDNPVKGAPTTKKWCVPQKIRDQLLDYKEKYVDT